MQEFQKGKHGAVLTFKGADNWNLGMNYAAQGEHKDLVEFFIEKGADDFTSVAKYAIKEKDILLLKSIVEKLENVWSME